LGWKVEDHQIEIEHEISPVGKIGVSGEAVAMGERDELLNGEVFYTLREAQIIIESRRRHPANPGLFTTSQKISVCIRMRGGGRSRYRTCLCILIRC
jgi:hypothetical protein